LLKTPFHQLHRDYDAKLIDFAGWEMPIMYTSIIDEHHHVRNEAGLFDVSHMGRIKIAGRHARRFLERILTRRISDMPERACRYSLICNAEGGARDDIIVYRFADHWLLVVNASNREKILEHLKANTGDAVVTIEDLTAATAMVAVQGPRVMEFVSKFSSEIPTLKRYHFTTKNMLVIKLIVSRTGYTGEDGVEIMLPANMANMAIKLFLKERTGEDAIRMRPVGLGARDTLRLEAGMPLYGHELTESIDPLSAGLGFAVCLDKESENGDEAFIGQRALQRIAGQGPKRRLVGLKLDGKRTPRQGMTVTIGDDAVGEVTSGCLSPTLGFPIALAYLDAEHASAGQAVHIDFNGKPIEAEQVKPPFYKRP